MTVKDSFTLEDIETYARKEFSRQYETIANEFSYNFEAHHLSTHRVGDVTTAKCMILHFAYSCHDPVWAHSDGSRVRYYHGEDRTVILYNPPFRLRGRQLIHTFQGPFLYVLAREQPQRLSGAEQNRGLELARKRFDLLVHLAFLITGHIDSISNPNNLDLLDDYKNLCKYLHNSKVARDGSRATVPDQTAIDSEDQVTEVASAGPEMEGIITMSSQTLAGDVDGATSGSKRPTATLNNFSVEITTNPSQKRIRTTRPSPVIEASEPPSQQLQSMFETLLVQCKSEAEVQWTTERINFEEQVRDLKAELSSEKERARAAEKEGMEWKDKYQKLKGRVSELMGDD